MRANRFLFTLLGATLISAGAATVHAQEGFYDPSNAASPTGKTIGHELFLTIGCPGRQLLDKPCTAPPVVAAAPEPEPEPAPVAAPAPEPAALAAPTPAPAAPQKLVMEGVNFDFDKAVIRQEDIPKLDRDVATLKEWGDVNVEVAGHTCNIGTDEYNMGLSQRRADAVRNYLISKGVSADRLTAKGYGESQPIADNSTREGRIQNRRVELVH